MSATCIALLRGVNVGGRNKVPMKELVPVVESLGGSDVRTYIQSGNVVFEASDALRRRAATELARAISTIFGVTTPVVLRTAEELRQVVAANPFVGSEQDEKELGVAFLADLPRAADVAKLDPDRSPPDVYEVVGREIYLRFPNGLARSRLTNAYFDSRLGTTSTIRNWRTTRKLVELAGG